MSSSRLPQPLPDRGAGATGVGAAARLAVSRFINHAILKAGGAQHSGEHDAPLAQVLLHPATPAEANQRNVLIDAVGVGLVGGVATFL